MDALSMSEVVLEADLRWDDLKFSAAVPAYLRLALDVLSTIWTSLGIRHGGQSPWLL